MKNEDWLDARAACAQLSVQPQTLYAYVSRGLVRVQSDPQDGRRSLYARSDVAALAARARRPRARADVAALAIRWGDPVLETAITDIRDGQLIFGTRPAADCANHMSLEEVAAHHWRVPPFDMGPSTSQIPDAPTPLGRALALLAAQAAEDPPLDGQTRGEIARTGAHLMADVASAFLDHPGSGPIHQRLSTAWAVQGEGADMIRRTLVLMSDHELNPSSFAVRVCASTGGPLSGAILAGMATLAGPRHGGVAPLAAQAAQAGAEGPAAIARFLASHKAKDPYGFGYGHPLYPDGDPRAAALLERLPQSAPSVQGVAAMADHLSLPPNIDAALAALVAVRGLPKDAGFTLFCLGRLAGWIAHAMEQTLSGHIIRPRARFSAANQPG